MHFVKIVKASKKVYHGSSNKNLIFKSNKPLLFFTTDKEDAISFAKRELLGDKRNNNSYLYTTILNYHKLYEPGDLFNPEYLKYKESDEKNQIYEEIFFDDINFNRLELVNAGFDCFHIKISNNIEYYIVPFECKDIIQFIDKEVIN